MKRAQIKEIQLNLVRIRQNREYYDSASYQFYRDMNLSDLATLRRQLQGA